MRGGASTRAIWTICDRFHDIGDLINSAKIGIDQFRVSVLWNLKSAYSRAQKLGP